MLLEGEWVANQQAEFAQVMAELKGHADQFPGHPTGLALYRGYAERLRKQQRTTEAKGCLSLWPDSAGSPRPPRFGTCWPKPSEKNRGSCVRRPLETSSRQASAGGTGTLSVPYLHPKQVKFMGPVD